MAKTTGRTRLQTLDPIEAMATKPKFFSWSKGRMSSAEPYYATDGLHPIDKSVGKEAVLASELKV